MDNKILNFWLTIASLITLVELFSFIMFCSVINNFEFKREYCLLLLPNLAYMMFQFIVNYGNEILDKD